MPKSGSAPKQLVKVKVPDSDVSVRQRSSLATRPEHVAERKILDLKRWYVLSLSLSLTFLQNVILYDCVAVHS